MRYRSSKGWQWLNVDFNIPLIFPIDSRIRDSNPRTFLWGPSGDKGAPSDSTPTSISHSVCTCSVVSFTGRLWRVFLSIQLICRFRELFRPVSESDREFHRCPSHKDGESHGCYVDGPLERGALMFEIIFLTIVQDFLVKTDVNFTYRN